MHVISAPNINYAYAKGLAYLAEHGVSTGSRNGPVYVAPEPVTTHYDRPLERVLFSAQRDANPFLHLFESLWMLNGRDDVAFLTRFTKRFLSFSDNGTTLNSAYGRRWRAHFGYDQLEEAIRQLSGSPDTRRVVVAMWDGHDLHNRTSKDLPCNLDVVFQKDVQGEFLNMTVLNRSNDIVWGAYGANVVHFSFLQEYVAAMVGWKVGWYEQVSVNYHAYHDTFDKCWPMSTDWLNEDGSGLPREGRTGPFAPGQVYNGYNACVVVPLVGSPRHFDTELAEFMRLMDADDPGTLAISTRNVFFESVAWPMWLAFTHYKAGELDEAIEVLASRRQLMNVDWIEAGEAWLRRRQANRAAK